MADQKDDKERDVLTTKAGHPEPPILEGDSPKQAELQASEEGQPEDGENEHVNRVMPMIPLRGLSIFPYMVLHFDIGREKSVTALEQAMMMSQMIFLTAQKDAETELPTIEDFYTVGAVVKIKQMLKLPGDVVRVLVEGVSRGRIKKMITEVPYFQCAVEEIPELEYKVVPVEMVAHMRVVLTAFEEYINYSAKLSREVLASVASIEDPGRLADVVASHMDIRVDEKQRILESIDVNKRLELISGYLNREIEILNMEQDISMKVKSQINKSQKEYFLREQLRVIQEELGQEESVEEEVDQWRIALEALKLPEKLNDKVEKEIKRFSRMMPSSAESAVIRTYIEWVLDLPWNHSSKDNKDLKKAQKSLDADHYGLEKVKERIVEYLAVMQLVGKLKGPILCLVGPPGVGKTSVARSVAKALNREFVRMSLGGVRDEAEIRGHRRTYIGAIPGRMISAIKDAGTNNPVFLLDEVDKIGNDYRGDPASALLEALDPEQNNDFTDHYLEMPFDLSKVLFITTANTTETIPRPLLDRMEVIELSGYTEEEKVKIAQAYLVPKSLKENGLKKENITFSEGALRKIINGYTRESGVRNVERKLSAVCRKAARKVAADKKKRIRITGVNLEAYLGKPRYHYDLIKEEDRVGVTTGMAWTAVGGVTLSIETAVLPGSGKLVLTGQLGEVMQESAKAGISCIRTRAKDWGIDEGFYKTCDLHIHIPEGATPKDGPSAGVTMCTSVISALTKRPVKRDVAMTGEITLLGDVLPVGGIREKVLAAHRAGITKILLPKENERDIEEIPANVRKQLEFVLLEHVEQAVEQALI